MAGPAVNGAGLKCPGGVAQAFAAFVLVLAGCGESASKDAGPTADDTVYATELPIEVLGPPGTARSVRVTVPEGVAAPAEGWRLGLTLHNVVEHDSVALMVNGGEAIDLSAPGVGFVRPTGGFARGEVRLAPEWLHAGENRLTFRYTRQVHDVSGFRVLAVVLLRGDETVWALDAWDDPADWLPQSDDTAVIEAGRRFFQEETRDGGPACTRCHARSGADLQYYAFSDTSLIARAMFHGFTEGEAAAIASYIRSLDVPRDGRPFRAPYQPGADNRGAAGASPAHVLADDGAFADAAFGAATLPGAIAWDWAAEVDTFTLGTTVQLPTWFRWLPRFLDDAWFEMEDGALAAAEEALESEPSLENAHRFMNVAVDLGQRLMVEQGDHGGRIELLRFAATKLWDWSRKQGFYEAHHGFPDDTYGDQGQRGSPAYPYEVGFAFFEAESAGHANALAQTTEWWWAQVAADPGRGRSNGSRPLNYADVLRASETEVGPMALSFLHLLGSWEESRGPMAERFGEDLGPVRLLATPMAHLDGAAKRTLLLRFVTQQAAWIDGGGALSSEHRTMFESAWREACPGALGRGSASRCRRGPSDGVGPAHCLRSVGSGRRPRPGRS